MAMEEMNAKMTIRSVLHKKVADADKLSRRENGLIVDMRNVIVLRGTDNANGSRFHMHMHKAILGGASREGPPDSSDMYSTPIG